MATPILRGFESFCPCLLHTCLLQGDVRPLGLRSGNVANNLMTSKSQSTRCKCQAPAQEPRFKHCLLRSVSRKDLKLLCSRRQGLQVQPRTEMLRGQRCKQRNRLGPSRPEVDRIWERKKDHPPKPARPK